MPTTPPARTPPSARKRKRYLRIAAAIVGGVVLGNVCLLLPEQHQLICHMAAKVVGLLLGSP